MMMFGMMAIASLCAVGGAMAYQHAPVTLKTPWGEKVTPENAWREYPRPQMERAQWQNLNGLWQYEILTCGKEGYAKTKSGEILVPYALESSLSGVGGNTLLKPEDYLRYRKTFKAPYKKGERVLLNFECVDYRASVFINGVEAGLPHEGGQVPFSYDVTDLLKAGDNLLEVRVWDPTESYYQSRGKQCFEPRGCFYTRSSGIVGTVWTETVPETRLNAYRATPNIKDGTVTISLDVAGDLANSAAKIEVLRSGKVVAESSVNSYLKPVTIKLPEPVALWSPENPNLYDLRITVLSESAKTKDVVTGWFGMRSFTRCKDAKGVLRFALNGKPYYILGTLDQGWWPESLLTPPSEEAMKYDIQMLKDCGFNMMRKHIKVEPRRYYALCDKMGILVLQDMPSGGGHVQHRYGEYRREWKEVMDELYNAPSIVMWVPYNEGWGQPNAYETHDSLAWTKKYDPSRLVCGPSGWIDYEGGYLRRRVDMHFAAEDKPKDPSVACDVVDMHRYIGPDMHPVNPYRISFLGEFGGLGQAIEGHLWNTKGSNWGYERAAERAIPAADRYVALMDKQIEFVKKGLAGSVYTQTTDVEVEINGLMTYDRKVMKFDPAKLRAAHKKVIEAADATASGK